MEYELRRENHYVIMMLDSILKPIQYVNQIPAGLNGTKQNNEQFDLMIDGNK